MNIRFLFGFLLFLHGSIAPSPLTTGIKKCFEQRALVNFAVAKQRDVSKISKRNLITGVEVPVIIAASGAAVAAAPVVLPVAIVGGAAVVYSVYTNGVDATAESAHNAVESAADKFSDTLDRLLGDAPQQHHHHCHHQHNTSVSATPTPSATLPQASTGVARAQVNVGLQIIQTPQVEKRASDFVSVGTTDEKKSNDGKNNKKSDGKKGNDSKSSGKKSEDAKPRRNAKADKPPRDTTAEKDPNARYVKTPTSNPEEFEKASKGKGMVDADGNRWKQDHLHKDKGVNNVAIPHWDVSKQNGDRVMEVAPDGKVIWPGGNKNKNKKS